MAIGEVKAWLANSRGGKCDGGSVKTSRIATTTEYCGVAVGKPAEMTNGGQPLPAGFGKPDSGARPQLHLASNAGRTMPGFDFDREPQHG
jgi:hypothetical protein